MNSEEVVVMWAELDISYLCVFGVLVLGDVLVSVSGVPLENVVFEGR